MNSPPGVSIDDPLRILSLSFFVNAFDNFDDIFFIVSRGPFFQYFQVNPAAASEDSFQLSKNISRAVLEIQGIKNKAIIQMVA